MNKDPNFWQSIQNWFVGNWWKVALIVVGAYIVRRFGTMLLTGFIRRTARHRSHGDLSEEDIKKRQDTLISMSAAVLRVLVWLVAAFSIVRLIFPTLDLTPILASASVLGVALGFGAQTVIKDFLSGLFIILENQYRVGDVVTLDSATGTVEQITIRSTVLRDNDGSVHYIPNGSITHAINKTMGFSKINLSVEVSPSTDVDQLSTIINELGTKLASDDKWKNKIMEPPHFLGIGTFTSTTLEVKIIGKTQPTAQWAVMNELRRRLLNAFKKAGIIAVKIPSDAATPAKKK